MKILTQYLLIMKHKLKSIRAALKLCRILFPRQYRRLMVNVQILAFITFLITGMAITQSCEKERCTTCSVKTNAPGASQSKSFCGTGSEISQEDARLKNECSGLEQQYPGYTFDCGCE